MPTRNKRLPTVVQILLTGSDEAEALRAELAAAHERLGDAERLAGTVAELEGELSFLRKVTRQSGVMLPCSVRVQDSPEFAGHLICARQGSAVFEQLDHRQAEGRNQRAYLSSDQTI